MIVLGGGAVACLALGYLGIQYMGEENDTDELDNTDETNDKDETNGDVTAKNLNFKKEIEEEITNIKDNVELGWGKFWKGAYEEEKNEKKEETNHIITTIGK